MSSKPTTQSIDKTTQIYNWLLTDTRCRQAVTEKAIQRVLDHKFNPDNNIDERDVTYINRGLRIPLLKETVSIILKLSRKLDREICFVVDTDATHNNAQPDKKHCDLRFCA